MALQLELWNDLSDKVVMVTGASSGLGREFCLDLAKAGCRIIAAARRVDRLKSLCDRINQSGAESRGPVAVAVELDVCAAGAAIEKSVQQAWNAFGRIDALINNAGLSGNAKNSLDLSEKEWDHIMNTNLKGSWLVSKYVCIRMRDSNRGGSVINISSVSGLERPLPPVSTAYVSSKTGLNAMTKVMAIELGEHKIRVNSVSPAVFESEITKSLIQKKWYPTVISRITPLGTFGTIDPALTSIIRYLIHDSSAYISGNIFIVDGGVTLPGIPIFSSL